MSSETRKYELKARADRQAETRRRIVEATAALHEEVGPAQTTVAEIARRAGVQRLTVYNNFPTDRELIDACSQHWMAKNPPPDPSRALAMGDPAESLLAVLRPLYTWYRNSAQGIEHLQRDRLVMPALDDVMRGQVDQSLNALADTLAGRFARSGRRSRRVRAAVALALDFWTWRRLNAAGMPDGEAAALMVGAVQASLTTST